MTKFNKALGLALIAALASACGSDTTPAASTNDAGTTTDATTTGDAVTGTDGSGTDASGTDVSGTDASGTDASGTDAGGTDAGGKDTTTADAAAGPSLTTCPALADCVLESCGKTAFAAGCETACLGDANKVALTGGAPLLTCTKDKCVPKCKDSKDPACLTDCITDSCGADFFACMKTDKNGTKICGDVLVCGDTCEVKKTGKFTCMADCLDTISAEGKKQFQAVSACQASGDDSKCMGLMLSCLTGGKSGTKKCADQIDCAGKCESIKTEGAQMACVGKCAAEITKADIGTFVGAAACSADFTEDCGATMAACLAPTGTDTCGAVVKCVQGCADGDDACTEACIMKGSEKAAAAAMEMALGCAADLDTCAGSFLTCMAPDGTASCGASLTCVSDCSGAAKEDECINGCLLNVKKSSVDLLKPVLLCGAKGEMATPACKTATGACVVDK